MMKRTILPCLAVTLGGCATSPEPEPTATSQALAAPVQLVAAPEPKPSTDAPPAEPVRSPALHVIARAGTDMLLHPLVDGTLLASAGPLVLRVDERGELLHDPAMLRGIESIRPFVSAFAEDDFEMVAAWRPVSLGGRWPDAVYLSLDVVSGFRGEGGVPVVYRWTPNGWAKLSTRGKHYEHYPAELHPWKDDSILARRVYMPWYPGQDEWEGDEGGPTEQQVEVAKQAIARAKKLVVIRGEPQAPELAATVAAFDSRATGEVFAVTGDASPSLVWLDAAGTRRTVPLPGTDVQVHGVRADSPDHVWVFGAVPANDGFAPWLVRVEGDRATLVEPPACTGLGLGSFAALPDGAQWATCSEPIEWMYERDESELWHRPAGGAWAPVSMPPGVESPRQVVARGPDDVWVAADAKDGGGVILHSRPRAGVLELPSLGKLNRQLLEHDDPRPVTKSCSYPYVPLRSPPAEAERVKAALDEPLRRLELASFSIVLVHTTLRGQPQLGLQLQDRQDVKKVVALARAALGKEMVDTPRCWFAEESETGGIARWDRKDP